MYYLNFTWIRIHMDIFGIPDPDPHKNSETVLRNGYLTAVLTSNYERVSEGSLWVVVSVAETVRF